MYRMDAEAIFALWRPALALVAGQPEENGASAGKAEEGAGSGAAGGSAAGDADGHAKDEEMEEGEAPPAAGVAEGAAPAGKLPQKEEGEETLRERKSQRLSRAAGGM